MNKIHINLTDAQKLFFTSDLHFGHRNIIRFCSRPVRDERHMKEVLIENWNRVVGEKDIVVDLGDLCWFDSNKEIQKIYNQLNGKIFQQMGNHDSERGFREMPKHVTLVDDITMYWITLPDDPTVYEVTASHFPLMTWPGRGRRKSINLFGHIHTCSTTNSTDFDGNLPLWKEQQYDVGTDNNGLTPIEFRDILKILKIT